MNPKFDTACQSAIDLAKSSLSDDSRLDVAPLLDALYYGTHLKEQMPDLGGYFQRPNPRRDPPDKVPLSDSLKPLIGALRTRPTVTAEELFLVLIKSEPGRKILASRGMPGDRLSQMESALASTGAQAGPSAGPSGPAEPQSWRSSPERKKAMAELGSYGRMLTDQEPPNRGRREMDRPLGALVTVLSKMKRHNAIVVGYPGTGKTALVYELARRIIHHDSSIPERLHEYDVFELSPTFLRSGASVVGQYEERIRKLIGVLSKHPKIILFVDEVHSLFQTGVHGGGPFSDANETFKGVLSRGEISCIGCTTLAEYKHAIEPDGALARRFELIRVDPPSAEVTLRILESRLPAVEKHYAPLRVPEDALRKTVELTEEYLPGRHQPDKSIQLLDQACAWCATKQPEATEVGEEALIQALEHSLGHRVVLPEQLTEKEVYRRLAEKIIGQDVVLHEIARAFTAGLGNWSRRKGPRGVYLFGGPTGVGKTEVAQLLAVILGGQRDALIRIDCNTLGGSGYDGGPTRNILLGVPPGYVGYARGQGGLLSKIRDLPASVVLFDEFEKAGPEVGELLLRIIDEGRSEDVDGNLLDFRRSYIIFTSNAGCTYDHSTMGFPTTDEEEEDLPTVDRGALLEELHRRVGLGQEFTARLSHMFLFQALSAQAIRQVLAMQLERLSETAEVRGYRLTWEPDLIDHLASQWQPRFGARFASAMLRNRISEQLSVAETQGELVGVAEIHLDKLAVSESAELSAATGAVSRERKGDTLFIHVT
ncbi:MAG TPA: AAA family ATPase [Thermoguttaceae bacterium]|nr:AAA family ATPase [Thermoguttaceae bacterium]